MGIILLLFIAVVAFYEKYTLDCGLRGVSIDYAPSARLVDPNEQFDIVTMVENRSRRFFPFIRLREEVPAQLRPETGELTGGINGHSARLAHTVYLLPRQRLTRRTRASLERRGRYLFNGILVYGGDFLGVSGKHESIDCVREIVVAPKASARPDVNRALGGFLGDVSVTRFLYEDPVLTLGFREYTGREPRKAISWTQTARTGAIQVKQYDHTLEPGVTVLLSAAGAAEMADGEARMEECFSIARSVCEALEHKHIKYRFQSNCVAPGMNAGWNSMGEGLGSAQYRTVLEGLGRATVHCRGALASMVTKAWRMAEPGRCHILIAPQTHRELAPFAQELERRCGGRTLTFSPAGKEENA